MDLVNTDLGYLIGTTNQLFLSLQKMKADVIVDLDEDVVIENLKFKHTIFEKKIFKFAQQKKKT
jgi:hypothetical protein